MPRIYTEKRRQAHAVRKSLAENLDKSPKITAFRTFLTDKRGNLPSPPSPLNRLPPLFLSKISIGVDQLLEFMKTEVNAENLYFILAVSKFKASYPSLNPIRTNQLIMDAMKIFNQFISEDSENTVNLSADIRDGI